MQNDGEEKKAFTPELNKLDAEIATKSRLLDKVEGINKKVQLIND
jgi:hypothetical protein